MIRYDNVNPAVKRARQLVLTDGRLDLRCASRIAGLRDHAD